LGDVTSVARLSKGAAYAGKDAFSVYADLHSEHPHCVPCRVKIRGADSCRVSRLDNSQYDNHSFSGD
jgi:hypothetical protein